MIFDANSASADQPRLFSRWKTFQASHDGFGWRFHPVNALNPSAAEEIDLQEGIWNPLS
jgi:phospholipase/lecithinase/hemolysin